MRAGVHRDDADSVRSVGCGILYTQGMLHVWCGVVKLCLNCELCSKCKLPIESGKSLSG